MDTGGLSAFSESYEEARGKFLAAAQAAGAELVALPVTEDEQGKYSIDIAICASKSAGPARGLVVISSGVHGVEGYAGSAIQISLLKQWKERPVASTAVFVHAVNPYGMAHFRRFNENNVDLNRNCLLPEQFERLRRSDVMAPVYGYFDPLFNPTVPPGAFYRNIGVWFEMAGYVARYGIGYIKNALVAGTYQHEKGIFFGGKELQPSHVLLRDFMTKRFGTTKAAEVAWVDVHTGLGPTGVDVMLGTKTAREMEELFPKVEGECDGYQALGMKVESVLEKRCGSNDVTLNQSGLSASQSAGYEFTVTARIV